LTLSVMPLAKRRLEEIQHYIAKDNPRGAIAMRDRIVRAFGRIAEFPKSGRTTDIINRREMVVTGTPYIILYRLTPKEIQIANIKHGKQL